MGFHDQLRRSWAASNSLLCVGLDPDPTRFPNALDVGHDAVFRFCKEIVDVTADLVCAFKPQIAYFASQREEAALEDCVEPAAEGNRLSPMMGQAVAHQGMQQVDGKHRSVAATCRFRGPLLGVGEGMMNGAVALRMRSQLMAIGRMVVADDHQRFRPQLLA